MGPKIDKTLPPDPALKLSNFWFSKASSRPDASFPTQLLTESQYVKIVATYIGMPHDDDVSVVVTTSP